MLTQKKLDERYKKRERHYKRVKKFFGNINISKKEIKWDITWE
jgi:hypothetical protein